MVVIKNNKDNNVSMTGKVYLGLLLIIFGGIALHAPISVGLSTLWPDYSLLFKSWKEILMLFAGVIALYLLYKNKKFKIFRDPIIIAIIIYALIHLILLIFIFQGVVASIAGLAIDLRYLLFFGLVYIAMRLYPNYRNLFTRVGVAGALIVLVFGVMQVFILPHDILKYIGYNINTISPYLTVDQNHDYIRINSFLRGPNPLGAYAGLVLTLLVAIIVKTKSLKNKWQLLIISILSVSGLVVLWASYSRSAMIATAVAIAIVLAMTLFHKLSTKLWIVIGILVVLVSVGLFMIRDTTFISNVILHENPNGGSSINSNEGHANSLIDGFNQLIRQPLGAGVGSTGSASLIGGKSEIIENQYLFIAHEVGWLGLAIFLFIFISIMIRLWKLRDDWLALGVFASGIGLALIGILLPVWVDDTVAIIWWGLAGLAIGSWKVASGQSQIANRQSQKANSRHKKGSKKDIIEL
jgi:hypothetical protein